MIGYKEPVDAVAGSLAGDLSRFVHLMEVAGGSGNGDWEIGKRVVR